MVVIVDRKFYAMIDWGCECSAEGVVRGTGTLKGPLQNFHLFLPTTHLRQNSCANLEEQTW